MKASDLFVKALENEGVEDIFGIPGEENLDLLEPISKSTLKLVLTRHEQAAGFMAATYSRLTGKIIVCISTLGPVAAIIPVKDEEDAIKMANDIVFGIGSTISTEDIEKGEKIATYELEAGCSFVNTFVRSDPRLHFGGIKESGYGRELSHYGIKEFVDVKTIYIK